MHSQKWSFSVVAVSYEVAPPKGWAVTTVAEEMDIQGVSRCDELGGGVAVGFRREEW